MTDRFGVVYSIGPSPLEATTVWVGTDDGLIHVTRDDGKNWKDVTPAGDDCVEQGLADRGRPLRCGDGLCVGRPPSLADNKPYIYRTHDGGKTWQNVVAGIPEGAYVNSVKEDPKDEGAAVCRNRAARLCFVQ